MLTGAVQYMVLQLFWYLLEPFIRIPLETFKQYQTVDSIHNLLLKVLYGINGSTQNLLWGFIQNLSTHDVLWRTLSLFKVDI